MVDSSVKNLSLDSIETTPELKKSKKTPNLLYRKLLL